MRDEREMRDGLDEQEKHEMQDSRIVEWRILRLLRVAHFSPILLVPLFWFISPPALQCFNQGPDHSTELVDTLSKFNGLLSVEVSNFFRNDHLGHYLTS